MNTTAWRRMFGELVGTFLLVMVAAGGPMMNARFDGSVGRVAAVVAPGLMVMAIILGMGKVSGAHLNPAVTLAFWMRRDFPLHRVPGYVIAQCAGGLLAALVLQAVIGVSAAQGGTYPGAGVSAWGVVAIEALLTFGLVGVILGTASGAQNVGVIGALGVGGYIALAGLWASPMSGASMNPVRSLAPDLVGADWTCWWAYIVGPMLGAVFAVGVAWMLRGAGGGRSGSLAAQGALHPLITKPEKD